MHNSLIAANLQKRFRANVPSLNKKGLAKKEGNKYNIFVLRQTRNCLPDIVKTLIYFKEEDT